LHLLTGVILFIALWTEGCRKAPAPPVLPETAAYWVLSKGGSVTIQRQGALQRATTLKELPFGGYTIHTIDLTAVNGFQAEELLAIARLHSLEALILRRSAITDAGLRHLAGFDNLHLLDLGETDVSDAGLKAVAGNRGLTILNLDGTQTEGTGLKYLAACRGLSELNLSHTPVAASAVRALKECHNLNSIDLTDTDVPEDAVAELRKSLKYCRITR
jgi:hypothetical protein